MINLDNQIVGKCRPNYKQFEFTYAGFLFPGPIGGYTILECKLGDQLFDRPPFRPQNPPKPLDSTTSPFNHH